MFPANMLFQANAFKPLSNVNYFGCFSQVKTFIWNLGSTYQMTDVHAYTQNGIDLVAVSVKKWFVHIYIFFSK